MPDIITHLVVAKRFLKEECECTIPISGREKIFYLGTQGPDIYYYHKYLIFRIDKEGVKLAVKMHTERTGEFIRECFKCTRNSDDKDLYAYFSGFLLHYLTDLYIHPYVFYRSGRHPPDSPERWEHKKMETSIDIEILKYYEEKVLNRFPYIDMVKIEKKKFDKIKNCLSETIPEFYPVKDDLETLTQEAYKDFISALRFARDRTGIKRNLLFPILSGILGLKFNLSVFVHPSSPVYVDPLNLGKRRWRHPVTGRIFYSSIPEIVEELLTFFRDLMMKIYKYFIKGSKKLPSFLNRNYSYDTGLLIEEEQEMKYFEN